LIVASDGLQFLPNSQIQKILGNCAAQSSKKISEDLLKALVDLGDPDQDNISFSVIKISRMAEAAAGAEVLLDINECAKFPFRTARKTDRATPASSRAVLQPTNLFRDYSEAYETGI
jgi:hypothetical protein